MRRWGNRVGVGFRAGSRAPSPILLPALLLLAGCTSGPLGITDPGCAVTWHPGVNGPCLQWTWTWVGVPEPDDFDGIRIQPEGSRSGYDRDDYGSGHRSLEDDIIRSLPKSGGRVYTPYTCTLYTIESDGTAATDIDHIVALAEAHDSGISAARRREFGGDILNLTIAVPTVNRNRKSDNDAAEWGPDRNEGWYAARVIEVKRKYGLSMDTAERDALAAMLARDSSRSVTCP